MTTRGLQACAPPTLVVVVLASVAALGLAATRLLEGRRRAVALGIGLIAASLLPLALTITTPAVPDGHDLPLHLWGLWGTARGTADGSPWPR